MIWKICSPPNTENIDYEKRMKHMLDKKLKDDLQVQETLRKKVIEDTLEKERRKEKNRIKKIHQILDLFYPRLL